MTITANGVEVEVKEGSHVYVAETDHTGKETEVHYKEWDESDPESINEKITSIRDQINNLTLELVELLRAEQKKAEAA